MRWTASSPTPSIEGQLLAGAVGASAMTIASLVASAPFLRALIERG
jgi:hypothetical protein